MRLRADLTIYARALPMLVRRPSIFAAPLLGAVIWLVLAQVGGYVTAPIGGAALGLFGFIANVFYSFAFAVAIIQADALERGLRGTFESAWDESRHKAGGIIMAAIGFWFVVTIAQYVGQMLGFGLSLILMLVAAFFLIDTIPAAAIGGLPGSLAISGSLRAVRADTFGAAVLAVAFIVLFIYMPVAVLGVILDHWALSREVALLLYAALQALALGYLAFPFAKQYADVAFRA